jgi:hypothetical protein
VLDLKDLRITISNLHIVDSLHTKAEAKIWMWCKTGDKFSKCLHIRDNDSTEKCIRGHNPFPVMCGIPVCSFLTPAVYANTNCTQKRGAGNV